jgi:hypothetical protein
VWWWYMTVIPALRMLRKESSLGLNNEFTSQNNKTKKVLKINIIKRSY